jgi:hypothetical protein
MLGALMLTPALSYFLLNPKSARDDAPVNPTLEKTYV